MFRLRMVFRQTADRREFRVGWLFRGLLLVMAAAVLAAGLTVGSWFLATVMAVFAVLGALYEETAAFDRARGIAEFRTGFVFLHRKKVVPLETVGEVRLAVFGAAKFTGLKVVLTEGVIRTIESDRGEASVRKLQQWGTDLAQWLGVPFTVTE